jgi:Regulator of chromosome condensation (RCC1) repeat
VFAARLLAELELSPVKALVEGCTAVSCGIDFTMWLCDGKVFSAGCPQYGQLGHGTDNEYNAKACKRGPFVGGGVCRRRQAASRQDSRLFRRRRCCCLADLQEPCVGGIKKQTDRQTDRLLLGRSAGAMHGWHRVSEDTPFTASGAQAKSHTVATHA